jgi:hypothetical protein
MRLYPPYEPRRRQSDCFVGFEKLQEACLFSGRASIIIQSAIPCRRVSTAAAACTQPGGSYSPGVIFSDERGLVMFRKVTIALVATAMLAPDVVSARGGGGGGFHGGGGSFHGGFGGGSLYRGDGFGRGGFHTARFSGGRFRGAAIGGRRAFQAGFRAGLIAGSRSAMHVPGQKGRPAVVRCITSDCSLWHIYSE